MAPSGADHGLHRAVVARSEREVGCDAHRAEVTLQQRLAAVVRVLPDHRGIVQHRHRHRRAVRDEPLGDRAHHEELVRPRAEHLDRKAGHRHLEHEADVEVARDQCLGEQLCLVLLGELDAQPGCGLAQTTDDRRQRPHRDALEDADVDRAGVAFRERAQVGPGRRHPCEDHHRVLVHELAGSREPHLPGAAGTVEQRSAHDPFEARDLLADRRLGVAESSRGGSERPLFDDGAEGDEMAELEARQIISRTDAHDSGSSLVVIASSSYVRLHAHARRLAPRAVPVDPSAVTGRSAATSRVGITSVGPDRRAGRVGPARTSAGPDVAARRGRERAGRDARCVRGAARSHRT